MTTRRIAAIALAVLLLVGVSFAQYRITWQSVNIGGRPGSGTGYNLNGSVGQSIQGVGSGTGYTGYWGFWYGFLTGGTAPGGDTGWIRLADVPAGPKNKYVKDGGCIAYAPGTDGSSIYALKGNGRYEFYQYNIDANTWATKESIPAIGSSGKKKAVKKGAAIAFADGSCYAAKGNNSLEWWQYTAGVWTQKTDVPMGAKTVREGAGAAAFKIGDTTFIYFLKGSATQEFYRYNTTAGTWQALENAPLGISGKTYKNGSCIASDGAGTIYAAKGSFNEFYAYTISTNTWATRHMIPLLGSSGKKKKIKDGAGLGYLDGQVYVTKGNNTQEFWSYAAATDTWQQFPDMPLGGGRRVKGGGALLSDGDANLYALKGNATQEFYRYTPATDRDPLAALTGAQNAAGAGTRLATARFEVAPNPLTAESRVRFTLSRPGSVSLRLYDLTGKSVATLARGHHTSGSYVIPIGLRDMVPGDSRFARGIYILKLESEGSTLTRKLVVE